MCSMKFPIKQMPCPRNVLSTKCPVYEISFQTNVLSMKQVLNIRV